MNRTKENPSNRFMNRDFYSMSQRLAAVCLALLAVPLTLSAAEPGAELAARLSEKQEGSTFVRLRMETGGAEKVTLQLQIKSRISHTNADIVYQVLFPKERKGESVLLHRSGGKFTGTVFAPPNDVRPIASGKLDEPLFGSDLSYEDIIDNPFTWEQQSIVGSEVVNGTPCQILESKPGKGRSSSYSSVRTWVDGRRFVPMRIEKYNATGKLVRRITTTHLLLDGGDSIPANLNVQGPRGTATQIDGSKIKRGVNYTDAEFTPEGLKQLSPPPGAPE
jgi:outer membrane lipoprotein-sorting protein